MIDVKELYDHIQNILLVKQAGYFSSVEYNSDLKRAQNDLLLYLTASDDKRVSSILRVFETEVTLNSGDSLPTDYYYDLGVTSYYFKNSSSGVQKVQFPAIKIDTDEEEFIISSPIRRPSLKNKVSYYAIKGSRFYGYDSSLKYILKYLRYPNTAYYAVTIDYVNEIEVYDSANTIHLEWAQEAFTYFVDLIAYYRGAGNREASIIQWLSSKALKHDERENSRISSNQAG